MKRRSAAVQKTGRSPYAKHGKHEYRYPVWVTDKRVAIPLEIEQSLRRARAGRNEPRSAA